MTSEFLQVASQIKNIRLLRKISQNELAKRAKVSQSSISEIEAGKRIPAIPTLTKLAAALDVPVTALLEGGRGGGDSDQDTNIHHSNCTTATSV
ncbi:MAG: helix-turn-helix transcriptional regulator [Peptococcaceae bacterium]|nr:helix-turn-helix transcriptional regulator [Peptococcaceae bacterium]